jgi:hypothetical protein
MILRLVISIIQVVVSDLMIQMIDEDEDYKMREV